VAVVGGSVAAAAATTFIAALRRRPALPWTGGPPLAFASELAFLTAAPLAAMTFAAPKSRTSAGNFDTSV